MPIPTPTVEIGFDLTDSAIGPFFVLDDSVRGRLDNTQYRLGGTIFFDVTDRVRNISVSRGKGRRFASFQAGQLQVEFNNHDRAFDPLYPDSPFAGNIIPRREIRVRLGTDIQFTGWIDDWDLSYTPDGNSLAGAVASDAFTILANQSLTAGTPVQQRTDQRIEATLDDVNVNWSESLRDLEEGTVDVGTQEITANTNALNYMQQVTQTEDGLFFINKTGSVSFKNRGEAPVSTGLVIFDQGNNIPFSKIGIIYGAELLYNQVNVANDGGLTQTANDLNSQAEYGIRELSLTNLLGATNQQSQDLADRLLFNFAEPEYRVEQLEITLHDLDEADQNTVLALELGSVCKVEFTPNGIGDPIERFLSVIRINHRVTPDRHFIEFGFQEIKRLFWRLSDPQFGKLSSGNRLGVN